MAESDWVTVGGKNKPRKQGHAGAPPPALAIPSAQAPSQARIDRTLNLAADAQREVAASRFYAGLKAVLSAASLSMPGGPTLLSNCSSMVMWGLGSLESSLVHIRYQLALARLLRELLGGSEIQLEAYDPVFSALDRAVMEASGVHVSSMNINGRHVASQPTLFYLPHCELELTEQLLSANVAAGTLCNVVILGNSFSLYKERWELKRGSGAKQRQQGGGRARSSTAQHGGGRARSSTAQHGGGGASGSTAQHGSGGASGSTAQQGGEIASNSAAQQDGRVASGSAALQGGGGTSDSAAQHGGREPLCSTVQQGDGEAFGSAAQQGQQDPGISQQLEFLSRPQGLLYDLCLIGVVDEQPVREAGFPVSSAFNDMALHTFSADWQGRLSRQRGL